MAISLEAFLSVVGAPVVAVEHAADGGARFWSRLEVLAPWLEVRRHPDGTSPRRTLLQGTRPHGPIRFVGDIERRILDPLVETLRALATGQLDWDTPATPALLRGIRPTELSVVVGPDCPFCPRVAAAALRFSCSSRDIGVTVVRSDDPVVSLNVTAVPTVLLQDRVVAVGSIEEYRLAQAVVQIPP